MMLSNSLFGSLHYLLTLTLVASMTLVLSDQNEYHHHIRSRQVSTMADHCTADMTSRNDFEKVVGDGFCVDAACQLYDYIMFENNESTNLFCADECASKCQTTTNNGFSYESSFVGLTISGNQCWCFFDNNGNANADNENLGTGPVADTIDWLDSNIKTCFRYIPFSSADSSGQIPSQCNPGRFDLNPSP